MRENARVTPAMVVVGASVCRVLWVQVGVVSAPDMGCALTENPHCTRRGMMVMLWRPSPMVVVMVVAVMVVVVAVVLLLLLVLVLLVPPSPLPTPDPLPSNCGSMRRMITRLMVPK